MANIDTRLVHLASNFSTTKSNSTALSNVAFTCVGLLKDEPDILQCKIQVLHAQIPASYYIINNSNNVLAYSVSGFARTITIANGNYNSASLIAEMISKFSANFTTFTITISSVTGILTFKLSSPTTYIFLSAGSTILQVLGFPTTTDSTSTGATLIAPYPLNLIGIKKILVLSNNLATSNHQLFSSNKGFSNLLGSIPISASSFGLTVYDNYHANESILRVKTIDNIDISLVDENGLLIDFNNVDWCLTLCIKIERSRPILSPESFSQIVKPILTSTTDENRIDDVKLPKDDLVKDELDLLANN